MTSFESPYQIGDLVADRYQVQELLGAGASGVVYRAVDQLLDGRTVALKVLHPHRVANERTRARFVNEVLLTRTLLHENIVRVFESGVTANGELFLVCEYVNGSSLTASARRERFEFSEIVRVLAALCQALRYAHGCGILHRDLKPDNILIAETGQVKLADFGIARRLDSEERLTRTGESVGTPYYMAPEMIAGRNVTERCDIYAFGVVAYELSEGRQPFHGPTYFDLLRQHATAEVPSIASPRPRWFRELIRWCLEKDPNLRPQSFQEVEEAIQRGIAHEQQSAAFRRSQLRRRLKRLGLPAGIAFVILLVSVGAVIAMRKSPRIGAWATYPILWLERETGVKLPLLRRVTGWGDVAIDGEGFRQMIDLSHSYNLEVALSVWRGPLPKLQKGKLVAGFSSDDDDIPLAAIAAISSDERALEILLEHGADPNEATRLGLTPLHWATMLGAEGSVRELLRYGADPNRIDASGVSPIFPAVSRDMRHAVTMLLQHGARIDLVSKNGNTVLSTAAVTGRAELFLMLLDLGAKMRPEQSDGAEVATVLDQVSERLAWLVNRPDLHHLLTGQVELLLRYLYRLGHVG